MASNNICSWLTKSKPLLVVNYKVVINVILKHAQLRMQSCKAYSVCTCLYNYAICTQLHNCSILNWKRNIKGNKVL